MRDAFRIEVKAPPESDTATLEVERHGGGFTLLLEFSRAQFPDSVSLASILSNIAYVLATGQEPPTIEEIARACGVEVSEPKKETLQ